MAEKIGDREREILDAIDTKVLSGLDLGFDPEVLQTLENVDANEREIEMLKAKISEEVLSRLFNIANSVHYGHLRKGKVDNFYQVVSRLGMSFTRTLIVALALIFPGQEQGSGDRFCPELCCFRAWGKDPCQRAWAQGG